MMRQIFLVDNLWCGWWRLLLAHLILILLLLVILSLKQLSGIHEVEDRQSSFLTGSYILLMLQLLSLQYRPRLRLFMWFRFLIPIQVLNIIFEFL